MKTFWINLLEINLILSLVYLGYILLLKNLTFFRWARFYLLGGMLTGLIYPFLKARQVVHTPAEAVTITLPDLSASLARTGNTSWDQWAVYLLSAIFLLFSAQFILRFFSLGKIHNRSSRAEFSGHVFRDTHHEVSPFSFWKWIYIHRKAHSDPEMKQIIAHEYIHTKERHSLDVIIAEICSILCWYNPLVKLLNRSVKDNLEFLVDAQVLNSGIDRVSYQHSLVGISLNSFPGTYPGNQFAFKTLKRRIHMMNRNRSPKSRLVAYMVMTPLVLAFAGMLTFSCQKETLDTIEKARESEGIAWERSAGTTPEKQESQGVELKAKGKVSGLSFEATDHNAALNGQVIVRGSSSNAADYLLILDGKEVDNQNLNTMKAENIQAIIVLKDKSAIEKYGNRAKNGVIEIYSKKSPR